jgi:plastocyanin
VYSGLYPHWRGISLPRGVGFRAVNGFVLAEASINAFVIAGGILAVWAVVVALLGMRGFPSSLGGERIAILITVILFVGAVGSAIADQTKVGERKGPEPKEKQQPAESNQASQGTGGGQSQPQTGGTQAPAGGGGKPTALVLSADPTGQTKFDKTTLSAPAGQVTITMTNPSPVGHNIALKGTGVDEKGKVVQGNAKSMVQADLKPGQYEFYCSVDSHAQAGMRGTLTVK